MGRVYSCWMLNLVVHHVTSRLHKVKISFMKINANWPWQVELYSFFQEIACLNAVSYIHLLPCTDKMLRTLRSVTWRAGRRSPRGTGAIIQVSPDPPISRACWWIYSVQYQALESTGVCHMHGATPGRDQLRRYTSEAEKHSGLEKIKIRRPRKKLFHEIWRRLYPSKTKRSIHTIPIYFIFISIIYLYMFRAGLLLIIRRYCQQPVNINPWHIPTAVQGCW